MATEQRPSNWRTQHNTVEGLAIGVQALNMLGHGDHRGQDQPLIGHITRVLFIRMFDQWSIDVHGVVIQGLHKASDKLHILFGIGLAP